MILKRGQSFETLWWVLNIFFLAVILISMLYIINSLSGNSSFERSYLAKDIALMVNNLYASPNEVLYYYVENKFPFKVKFEPNKVIIQDPEEGAVSQKEHYFVEDEKLNFRYKEISPVVVEQYGGGEETVFIPISFIKTNTKIEPYPVLRTSDVLGDGTGAGSGSGDAISTYSYQTFTSSDNVKYYTVHAPANPAIVIATKPITGELGKTTFAWADTINPRLNNRLYAAVNANLYDSLTNVNGVAVGEGTRTEGDTKMTGVFEVTDSGINVVDLWYDVDKANYLRDFNSGQKVLKEAVSGQPVLVKNCMIMDDYINWYPCNPEICFAHSVRPRTAVGINKADNTIYFVIFERATLMQAATIIRNEVCKCASDGEKECTFVNLDGGGSTQLWYRDGGRIFSGQASVCGGGPECTDRTVSNHIGILMQENQ